VLKLQGVSLDPTNMAGAVAAVFNILDKYAVIVEPGGRKSIASVRSPPEGEGRGGGSRERGGFTPAARVSLDAHGRPARKPLRPKMATDAPKLEP